MESNTSSQVNGPGKSSNFDRFDHALATAMRVVWDVLLNFDIPHRLKMIAKCRLILDSIEASAIASQFDSDVSQRKIENMLHSAGAGRISKKTVKAKARRGAVVAKNPKLASKMAAGDLSDEQLDVLALASDRTNGEAACNDELIDKIAANPPEQAKKLANTFIRDRQSQDDVDSAHARVRRRRRVNRYTNEERGTDVLQIEGSATDIDRIEERIDHLAEYFYDQDGGRETSPDNHRRTRDQRRFDAAVALITSPEHPGDTNEEPATERVPKGGDTHAQGERDATTGERNRQNRRAKPPTPTWKTTIVINASLDQALGLDGSPLTLADGQRLPSSIAERLACGAEMIGQVFGADGSILWQGRAVRSATYAQRIALISRDGGCVRCCTPYPRCEVHHLTPWTSWLQGESNVEEMALVCTDCHHHIHDNHLTLYQDGAGTWKLRPAEPNEIASDRPRADVRNRKSVESTPAHRAAKQPTVTTPETIRRE